MPTWKKVILENSAPLVSSSAIVAGESLTDGYVTSIAPSTQINDILSDLNIAMGRLAPSRPAGLTNTTLFISSPTTTYRSTIRHAADWTGISGSAPQYDTVIGSTTLTLTSSNASTAASQSKIEFSGSAGLGIAPAGSGSFTFSTTPPVGSNAGTFLKVGNIIDPYEATRPQFWYTFSASMVSVTAPVDGATFSSASYVLKESGGGTSVTRSIFTDTVRAPSVTVTTNNLNITAPSTYISGVPTLITGSTVCNYTASISNAVSKFYRNAILDVTEANGVFTSQTSVTPQSIPASASSVTITGSLTVATGKYADPINGTGATITTTGYNTQGSTGTNTATFSDVYIDSVSVETNRVYSSASTAYPSTIVGYPKAFNSTVALTNAVNQYGGIVEYQLRNGVYVKPSGDYTPLYNPSAGPNYSGLSSFTSASFSQFYSYSATNVNLRMGLSGSGFSTTIAVNTIANTQILLKLAYGSGQFTKWGNANLDAATGGQGEDGTGLVTNTITYTSTRNTRLLNLTKFNDGTFNASSTAVTGIYVRMINHQPSTIASVSQSIAFYV